jgi:hypothetical protein
MHVQFRSSLGLVSTGARAWMVGGVRTLALSADAKQRYDNVRSVIELHGCGVRVYAPML